MFNKNYKELSFYQSSREIIPLIYECTKTFPQEEQGFTGIVNQMRRASISVSSNIAEGSSRGKKEYYHFLCLSLGSLREIETQLEISRDLSFIGNPEYEKIHKLIDKTISKLCGYLRSLGKDSF